MPTFYVNPHAKESREQQYRDYLDLKEAKNIDDARRFLPEFYQPRFNAARNNAASAKIEPEKLDAEAVIDAVEITCGDLDKNTFAFAETMGKDNPIETERAVMVDWRLALTVDQARIERIFLKDIQIQFRLSVAEAELGVKIEQGLKHYKDGALDHDIYQNALKRMGEVVLAKPDNYVLLHRIGLIYLYVPEFFNAAKAEDYLRRAFAAAENEDDALALPLLQVLYGDTLKFDKALNIAVADSCFHASVACYVQGKFRESAELALKAVDLSPLHHEAQFLAAKSLAASGDESEAVKHLKPLITKEPFYAFKTAVDADLIPKASILKLLSELRDDAVEKVQKKLKKCRADVLPESDAVMVIADLDRRLEMRLSYLNARGVMDELMRERQWKVLPTTFKLQKTLSGHSLRINSMAFSPNGATLAAASWKTTITDTKTGEEVQTFTSGSARTYVYAVAFSPNGKLLVTGSSDRTVKMWDVATGAELRTLTGHTQAVNSVAFSPDGKLLATGSTDKTVRVWDVEKGKELRRFVGHKHTVNMVAFSPDGKSIASASADKTVRIWDVQNRRKPKALTGHTHNVTSLAFSPNGEVLVSGGWDKTARLWNVGSSKELNVFGGHESGVEAVSFSRDGKTLTSTSYNRMNKQCQIKLWDMGTGAEIDKTDGKFYAVTFSPDGSGLAVATGEKTIKLSTSPLLSIESFIDLERKFKEGAEVLDRRSGKQRVDRRKVNIPVATERRKGPRPQRRKEGSVDDVPFA